MNRKLFFTVGSVVVIVMVLAFAGVTYARANVAPLGMGMIGGSGMMNGTMMSGMRENMQHGIMHDAMFDAIAEGMGITRQELDKRVEDGESLAEIAESFGFDTEQLASIHETAIQQMIDEGALTQEQADWMREHMDEIGVEPGACPHFSNYPETNS